MVLTPLANFLLRAEENTQSPKQGTKCKIYFYHLFRNVFHWTLEMRLWRPWEIIFAGKPIFPFNDRKLPFKKFCFQKNFWKWSSAQLVYGFENHALLFSWKSKFFLLRFQNWLKKTNFPGLFPQFFSFRTLIGSLTHLTKQLCKKKGNYWNSKNDNKKRKLFRKRNLFSTKFFSGSANLCWLNLEKNSWLKDPFFSSQSPKKVEIMFTFRKKCFSSKPCKDT